MKTRIIILAFLMSLMSSGLKGQSGEDLQVYLITCAPGTATYSIYGHSALRIIIPDKSSDMVYNWGVFDFATPNFAWKFAKGRLDYMLAVYPFERFLQDYFLEQRSVYQQKINLSPQEKEKLLSLLAENLKPENVSYRYDFFYDDCSTRIRDILESATDNKLLYPPDQNRNEFTFRAKVSQYQQPYPWLEFGIDLIMGTPADKQASFRDVMFLPLDLQKNLSEAVINRNGKMIPILQNPDTLLSFPDPDTKSSFLTSPVFVFSLVLIILILISALKLNRKVIDIIDITILSIFSVLSILIFFFSFFTDHQQMKMNLNIIWLSPFIIVGLAGLLLRKDWKIWYRIVFFLCMLFIVIMLVFPAGFNNAFLPMALIIALRSSVRADFGWNPLSLKTI